MVTVGMNYEVIEGREGEFEKVFAKVLTVMERMGGHHESHLYRDVAKANSYLIVSEWTSEQEFDAFTKSEQFRGVVDWGKEKILASRPKHEVYGRAPAAKPEKCPMH
ncbi:MAG: antibiotic biosynthesis monooxygenase [Phycisphaerales bacterium]|nr:antibiotic biosynthesis monooxygenase [Phycisphaerales bacterium]